MKIRYFATACISASLILASCGEDTTESTEGGGSDEIKVEINIKDTTRTFEAKVGEYKFVVPSPVQTATFIKNSKATFNENLVNSTDNVSNYSTSFQKALNLGLYGADLAYLTVYERSENSLNYLQAANNLANDLDLSAAFGTVMEEFSKLESTEADSLQKFVGKAYQAGNDYLQQEKRFDVIGLILTGGVIETMHFACHVATEDDSQEVLNRIGSQKGSINNLKGLLNEYASDNDLIADLVSKLDKLANEMNAIETTYVPGKSKTIEDKKVTYITGASNMTITPEQLENITSIVAEIRTSIVE